LTIHSTAFSSNYRSLGSVQVPSYSVRSASSTASVYAGTRGLGFSISMSHPTSFQGLWGSGGLAMGMAGGLAGIGGIQTKKETMQELNNHLASYLDRVRNLENDNQSLESKIQEHLEKKGPQVRDWVHYFKTIKDQRAQIFINSVDNACIILQIDNAHLAADDFGVKRDRTGHVPSVESDIYELCKVIDDTNITLLQLESEIEALKKELLFRRRTTRTQVAHSGLTVEGDAPKSQDLNKIMADMRTQYDELAETWSQQIEVGAAKTMLTELTRKVQSFEIELDSMRNQKSRLEDSLREVEACYAMQMEQLNGVLLHLESELAQTQAEAQEYEALLNIKVKLAAQIATYCWLLEDGKDFNLGDALDSSNSIQTIQKTTTHRIVDGKVVSETNDTKVLTH
uniref:IF rod domain-containing protein n=1 Tax=Otolemur garnettii TaxID=30611 RepID=H0Y247_OTOGA